MITVFNLIFQVIEECRSTTLSPAEISQLIHKMEQTFLVSIKTTLANLLLFTASDITFSTIDVGMLPRVCVQLPN